MKASTQTHLEVGDRNNDAVRVDASQLRCLVIGEGGNLGLTQRARIEYARGGGMVNTDAIDNSAGVDTSDHEVNIKILLDQLVAAGTVAPLDRNSLLVAMTPEVASLVLEDNIDQNRALVNAVSAAPSMLDVHGRYITHLETTANLGRRLEALPDNETLSERKGRGEGLVVPELAVLLAHTKLHLSAELLHAEATDDPAFGPALVAYFPSLIREKFIEHIGNHPLAAEITATAVVNDMVNRNGVTFAFRMMEETQAGVPDIVRAHIAATQLFRADDLWNSITDLGAGLESPTQVAMLLEVDRLVERASRWLLRRRRLPLDVAGVIADFADGVALVERRIGELLSASERTRFTERADGWAAAGVPRDLAGRVAVLAELPAALDIARVAQEGFGADDVADVYFTIDERLGLDLLRATIVSLPRGERWDALARAALRDDLATEHAALTAVVLAAAPDKPADERMDVWAALHPTALDRFLAVLREVAESGAVNVATMSVALRALRTLAVSR